MIEKVLTIASLIVFMALTVAVALITTIIAGVILLLGAIYSKGISSMYLDYKETAHVVFFLPLEALGFMWMVLVNIVKGNK